MADLCGKGAAPMRPHLPCAQELLDDKSSYSRRFRTPLIARGVMLCIPSGNSRRIPVPCDGAFYRQRHRIKNKFGASGMGALSPCATTDAPISSSRPSACPQVCSPGSMSPAKGSSGWKRLAASRRSRLAWSQ